MQVGRLPRLGARLARCPLAQPCEILCCGPQAGTVAQDARAAGHDLLQFAADIRADQARWPAVGHRVLPSRQAGGDVRADPLGEDETLEK